jgi:hypothetical protein
MSEKTPEIQWEKVKLSLWGSDAPTKIDEHVKKGFAESESESEKWIILMLTMGMIAKKYNIKLR